MSLHVAVPTIRQALAAQRIGTPVAARVIAQTIRPPVDRAVYAAKVAAAVCEWLGDEPRSLWAHGNSDQGDLTLLLRMSRGGTALLSVGAAPPAGPRCEVLVYGNQGILSWEGDDGGSDADTNWAGLTLTSTEQRLQKGLQKALLTRQSVLWVAGDLVTAPESAEVGSASPSALSLGRRETRRPLQPPYGLLLVGGDYTHQPGYAEALRNDPRVQLVGLTDGPCDDRRRALNERLAQRLGTRVLPDLQEALQRPDVHLVSICSEPERRAPLIIAAAAARRHLFLDKPLCASAAEARQIVTAVRQHGILAHMFTQVAFDPAARARHVVDAGDLGEIRAVHCDICFAKGHVGTAKLGQPRLESHSPRHFELPDAKRELTNIGVYGVAMVLWLLRRPARRVFASTGNYYFREHQDRDCEDFGQILLELDGGVTATVTAGRTGWKSHPSGGLHRIVLVGERGTAVLDAHRPRAELWSTGEPWSPPPRDPDDPLAMWAPLPNSPYIATPKRDWFAPHTIAWSVETGRFLDALEQGRDSDLPVEVAAATTEILLGAYRSAASERVVEV